MREKDQLRHRGIRMVSYQIELSGPVAIALSKNAIRLNTKVAKLIVDLIETVISDNLVDAVLDIDPSPVKSTAPHGKRPAA